jgi:polar amino acid transport system substrate-binding protein
VQEGKLIMGTNAAFPPYEFIDDDGETIVGIDAEIAALIAGELGLELQIEDMEFSSIISAVQSGKIDMGMAGMTVTEERLQNVNFSSSYATGIQVVIVPEDSAIASVDDLEGAMIGVQESTTGHIYCEDDFGAENVVAYSTGVLAVQALLAGKVDCVVIDNEPAKAYVAANEGLKILDTEYVEEHYAACFNKENEALMNAFNAVLDAKIADGTVKAIIDKYISAE